MAIADGNLDTRVAERVNRRDEIGLLAQDFDRMADELQRAWLRQTELSRNVSHELRSPLARLRVALELARRKAGDLTEFEKIDLETERLDEMIGQILEFSRLDAEPHEERVAVDFDELVRSTVEDVRYEYGGEAGIAIQSDADCVISGYPGALRSALENVLRNAMQHSQGKGDVGVRLHVDGSHAVLTVDDQGGGVPEDEVDKIFEPFYRSASGEVASNGTGLGLAIAARAIGMNDGSITARNNTRGLSIEFRLPVAS